ncbi:MAG: hypothetical protein DRR19_11395, partial [Candidatus Parabeggiatoa sp. nov. 1]
MKGTTDFGAGQKDVQVVMLSLFLAIVSLDDQEFKSLAHTFRRQILSHRGIASVSITKYFKINFLQLYIGDR